MVRIFAFWARAKASYWFIPTLMNIGAIVLFAIAIWLDRVMQDHWVNEWLLSSRPAGARDLLTTVAASLITVGGVAFSVTVGAVVYSATQFGPRLLTNFMNDRGNQVALGTFISVFLFSILVLLTIRGAEEADAGIFVPHLTITLNLLLVFFSLGVLIYFFHHVLDSVHVFNVVGRIGNQFNETVVELFPERIGEGGLGTTEHQDEVNLPEAWEREARLVRAQRDGYIQAIDDAGLFRIACEQDLILKLVFQPGDFVNAGRVVIQAWPGERVTDDVADALADAYVVGNQRTPYQDAMFLIKELVEFAARALSPGQNDPYTAITCINWLGSNLVSLSERATPDPRRFDDQRKLRVLAEPLTFDQVADTVFDSLRPYVKRDPNVSAHMMDMIRWVAPQLRLPKQRELLRGHADALKESCEELSGDRNHTIICDLYRDAVKKLTQPDTAFAEAQPDSISRAARQQG